MYVLFIEDKNLNRDDKLYMNELKNSLTKLHFTNIKTIGNDGTVLVDSKKEFQTAWLTRELTRLLNRKTELAVKSVDELLELLEKAPSWWDGDVNWRHHILFLRGEKEIEFIKELQTDGEVEKLFLDGDTLLWSYEFANRSLYEKCIFAKLKSYEIYDNIIIRNNLTVNKILEKSNRITRK